MQCYSLLPITQNGERFWVPCNKCNFCLQNRRNDWAFRLIQEEKASRAAHFITLTYDNAHIPMTWEDDMPIAATLDKKDLHRFHHAIRRSQKRLLKEYYQDHKPIRYYSVGEYGSRTERPHYHTIMFNLHQETVNKLAEGKIWDKGHVYIGSVNMGSCSYVAKYLIDKENWDETVREKPFTVMSRRPGIGHSYLEKNGAWHREEHDYDPENFRIYAIQDGKKVRLPRYYKDRIFKNVEEAYQDVMKTSLEIHYMELSEQFEKSYIAEIERLESLHPNPIEYYHERRKHHHNQIRIKSLKLNKL